MARAQQRVLSLADRSTMFVVERVLSLLIVWAFLVFEHYNYKGRGGGGRGLIFYYLCVTLPPIQCLILTTCTSSVCLGFSLGVQQYTLVVMKT